MSSKEIEGETDGAASRCSSELLSQSDVDNHNANDASLSRTQHLPRMSSPLVRCDGDSTTHAQFQEETDVQLSKSDLMNLLSGKPRARSSTMGDRREDVYNSPSKDDEDTIPLPFPSKVPFKQFTERMPLASGFNKRFRKCNSATFKLDGMSYLIGRLLVFFTTMLSGNEWKIKLWSLIHWHFWI